MRALFAILALSLATPAIAEPPPEDGPTPTPEYVAEVNDRWGGVGVGMDLGLWGSRFGSGLKVDVPLGNGMLGQHLGVRGRMLVVQEDTPNGMTPVIAGGAELFGRGPVLLGVLRVYGAGGFYYGGTLNVEPHKLHAPELVGGGHFGVEFAVSKRQSFTFEVGGQGPIHPSEIDGGASVMAGTTIWLGKVDR